MKGLFVNQRTMSRLSWVEGSELSRKLKGEVQSPAHAQFALENFPSGVGSLPLTSQDEDVA